MPDLTPDLTPDHPAVKALVAGLDLEDTPAEALTDAMHNLTADDLRHTTEGRKLMAEVWEACADEFCKQGTVQVPANPYEEAPNG